MNTGIHKQISEEKNPLAELASSLKRLDFYYDSVKHNIEDLLLGQENAGTAALGLDDLAWELEDVVNDIRNLAHRLRETVA
jgi:hypothetical protein